jgi:hypothetical protein
LKQKLKTTDLTQLVLFIHKTKWLRDQEQPNIGTELKSANLGWLLLTIPESLERRAESIQAEE